MRKYLFLVPVLIVALVAVSCEPKEIRTLKKEFKNYVNNTFDDPSAFKELVSILPYDTLSSVKTKTMFNNVIASSEESIAYFKEAINKHQEEMTEMVNKINPYSYSYYQRNKIQNLGQEVVLLLIDALQDESRLILNVDEIKKFNDGIKYEIPIYGYEIKYRCRTEDGIKLMNCYGYIDSLKLFRAMRPSQLTCDDYSLQQKQAYELLKDNVKYLSTILDNIESAEEKMKKLRLLI